MKFLPLLPLCAFALFGGACEKHPLEQPYGTDPHPGHHAEHGGEAGEVKHSNSAEHPAPAPAGGEAVKAEAPKPEAGKTEEAPKFFPEKK